MTNTEHATLRTKTTKALALSTLAMLLVLGLSLLSTQKQADALIFYTAYTVNYTGDAPDVDPGNGICDTNLNVLGDQCTLRAAIQEANATTGTQVIDFDIPGTGVHTITPGTQLPTITDAVTISGYSQPGSSVNTLAKGTDAKPKIEIDGSKAGTLSHGLSAVAPNVVIKGLVIDRFHDLPLVVSGEDSRVEGNFIGTDPSGTQVRANETSPGLVTGAVVVGGDGVVVGGTTPAARNLISGNEGNGVRVNANSSRISGNLIGTSKDGKSPMGNSGSGVLITGTGNLVGGEPGSANTIAFNGGDGVSLPAQAKANFANAIYKNSIFSNGLLGIDLQGGTESAGGVTANDPGDYDVGPDNLQNRPVLSSARKSAAGKIVVKGKLNSHPDRTYILQFFSDPKGNEGKTLLGQKVATTDDAGNAAFTFSSKKSVKVGHNVTATATDNVIRDTSEFSAPKKVVAS